MKKSLLIALCAIMILTSSILVCYAEESADKVEYTAAQDWLIAGDSQEIPHKDTDIRSFDKSGELLCTLSGRNYYKAYDGWAITAYYYCSSGYSGPILVSDVAENVAFSTSHDGNIHTYGGTVTYGAKTYYYSSPDYFMSGNHTNTAATELYRCNGGNMLSTQNAALEVLEKYHGDIHNKFILTPNATWKKGAIWYNYCYAEDFELELDYYTGVSTTALGGADGLVIAFYADFTYSIAGGEAMGFSGCNGYGIELDTYRNQNQGDPNYNHIALIKNSVGNHLSKAALPESEDDKWHHIKISVIDGSLNVYVDGVTKLSTTIEKTGNGWIGITSATGDGTNLHSVKNISITGERTGSINSFFDVETTQSKSSSCLSDITDKCEYVISATVTNNANATAPNVSAELIFDESVHVMSTPVVSLGSIPSTMSQVASWNVIADWPEKLTDINYQLKIVIGNSITITRNGVLHTVPYDDDANHAGGVGWYTTPTAHTLKYECCGKIVEDEKPHSWDNGVCLECQYACAHTGGEATCTEAPMCKICGSVYGTSLGHDITVHVAKEPTCTTPGWDTYETCERGGCDYSTYKEIPASHTVITDAALTPTCTDGGLTEGSHCSACGEVLTKQEPIAALGHDIKTTAAKSPTCTEIGWEAYETCTRCDHTTYSELAALGHTEVTDARVEPTCTKEGLTEGSHCSVCDAIIVAQTEIQKLSHVYDDKYDKSCNECGFIRDAECAHTKLETVSGKAPTCTEIGWETYETCLECGYTTYTELPALGHTEVSDARVEPTCTEKGLTEGSHCSACDLIIVAQTEIPMLPHSYDDKYDESCNECGFIRDAECAHTELETLPGKAPTCTEDGLTDGARCKMCGEIVTAQEKISATGHNVVTDKAVKPTCTEPGLTEGSHCSVCDTVIVAQTVIDTPGHTVVHSLKENVIEPTCETGGSYDEIRRCEICNTDISRTTVTVDALGHNEMAHPAKAPTCTKSGWDTYIACTRCEYTTRVEIPALGHTRDYITDEFTHALNCSRCHVTTGKEEHSGGTATCQNKASCEVCGTVYGKFGSHSYTEPTCKEKASCITCGITNGELAPHNYTEPTCTEKASCITCGITSGELAPHNYTEPTCTAPSVCTVCGTEGEGALGHDLGEPVIALEPTDKTDGESRRYCSACDYYESSVVEKTASDDGDMTMIIIVSAAIAATALIATVAFVTIRKKNKSKS